MEEVLIQRAVKTTYQMFYHKGFFDNYDNADEVSKFLFFEKHRQNLEEINDDVIQGFCW